MRYVAVAVIALVLLVAGTASGQGYEPYHRPGEQPLGFDSADVKISEEAAEYDYTLHLLGERDVISASGLAKMQVFGKTDKTYAIGIALRLTSAKGFPKEIEKRLTGAYTEVMFLLDSRTHKPLAAEPKEAMAPNAVFTAGFADYLVIRHMLFAISWIEPGMKFALGNKQQLSFGEVRDPDTGNRFIRMWAEKQNTASFAVTKLPPIEATFVPHWPLIRTFWLVWGKPVNLPAPIGQRLPALSLKLR